MNQKVLSAGLLFLMCHSTHGCFPEIFSCGSSQEKDEGTRGAQAFITPKSSSLFHNVMRRGDHSFDQTYEVYYVSQDLRAELLSLIRQKITFVLQDPEMMSWPNNNLNGYTLEDPSREHMRQWAVFILQRKEGEILNVPLGNLKQSFSAMAKDEKIDLIQMALYSTISGDDL